MILHIPKLFFSLLLILLFQGCSPSANPARFLVYPRPDAHLQARPEPPHLHLRVSSQTMERLRQHRTAALAEGQLLEAQKIYYAAKLDGLNHKIKIRLKGDMPDHWIRENHWSFRIKLTNGDTFLGTSSFSLQHPDTRQGVWEPLANRLFRQQGFLTPNYRWVFLSINSKDLGLYAFEESFSSKNIATHQGRQESMILRLDTEGVGKINPDLPFSARQLQAFHTSKIENNPQQLAQLHKIQKKYAQTLKDPRLANTVFNLPRYARFVALTDFLCSFHLHYIGNIRLYLDPRSKLLEPMAADFLLGQKLYHPFGLALARTNNPDKTAMPLVALIARHPQFRTAYIKALEQYNSNAFFNQFIKNNATWMEQQILYLRKYLPRPPDHWGKYGPTDGSSIFAFHDINLNLLLHNQVFMAKGLTRYKLLDSQLTAGKKIPPPQ